MPHPGGLVGNQRAFRTARLFWAKMGASRMGFTPRDVEVGALRTGTYIWARVNFPTGTWTAVKR